MAQAGHFIAFANKQTVASLVHQLRQLSWWYNAVDSNPISCYCL